MTLTAIYNDDIARTRLTVSGAPSDADYAHFEWSTDNINWYDVRGGQTVSLVSGACVLDDYKFTPGVTNYYRASYVDSAPQTWVGSGGPVTGNNASVNPACSGSTLVGDLVLLYATIRNSGAGVPVQPAGWTTLVDMGNAKLFGRIATAPGSVAQAVTFTGGVANADTTGQMTTLRNTSIVPAGTPSVQTNGSAQNIAYPASTPSVAGVYAVVLGWKQDDWSSAPTVSGWDSEAGQVAATAGDDAGHVWWVRAKTSTSQQPAGSWTVTGGGSAISKAAMAFFPPRPYVSQDTASNVPNMTSVWLKNVLRPNLNRPITPVGRIEITRKSRSGVFPIVGRSNPITVTDVRGSREFVLNVSVADAAERDEITNTLATGDTMYLHVPAGGPVSSVFVLVGDTAWSDELFTYQLPMTEVAEPDGTLVGDTVLWVDVVVEFATWTDLIAAESTWSDVVSQIADGSSVIVP